MPVCDDDFNNVNPGEIRVLLPDEGCYPAQFIGYEAKRYSGWGEKLICQWKVLTTPDRTHFTILPRYYNLERDGGNRFKFGPLHDYSKDWVAANGGRHPLDRCNRSISIFRERLFLVEVVTVQYDSKGRSIPATFHWSKIDRVIRPIEEGEEWERLPLQAQGI